MKKLLTLLIVFLVFQLSYSQLEDFPEIEVTPDSLSESLLTGGTTNQILTISNNGDSELEFEISIEYITNEEYQNYALDFDGFEDQVVISDHPSLQLDTYMTVEAWGYIRTIDYNHDHQPIIWRGNSIGWGNDYNFRIAIGGDGQVTWGSGGQNGAENYFFDGTIETHQWYHYAYVVDSNIITAFIDGEEVGSIDAVPPYVVEDYETYLGWATGNGYVYTDGIIDEVRIWNVARTQQEIQLNMHWEQMGNEPGLVGYWRLNEGSGSTAYDNSPNSNTGSLINDPDWVISDAPVMPRQWLAVEPGAGQVGPGASLDLDVNFDATGLQGGAYDAHIIITSNDPQTPETIIPVHLEVTDAPDITVSTDTITFEGTFIEDSLTYPLTISNMGFDLLEISDISCADPEFFNDSSNFILDPLESYVVNVTFTPTAEQTYQSTLTISSNDPDQPIYNVTLLGEGLLPPVIVIDPDSLSDVLYAGKTSTQLLSINNTGLSDLNWEVTMNNTGFNTITFTKEDNANWTLPENQDCITDNVCITRANTEGIFNAHSEYSFDASISPENTEWAFGYSAQLQPEDYQVWGYAVNFSPPSMVDQPISLHLISDDIYFDILFHSWTSGGNGGGFSYTRSSLLPMWFDLSQQAGIIPAGSSFQMDAIFNAFNMEAGMYDGLITISSNDPLNPEVIVPVHMEVLDAPAIYTATDTLDFGQMFIGDSDTLELLVENPGSMDLLIFSVEASPEEYSIFPPFASIDPGESEIFQVIFSTDSVADFPGIISFTSNDPLTPDYTVIISGKGVEAPIISFSPDSLIVDLFSGQSATPPFTITNSGGSDLILQFTPSENAPGYAMEFDGIDDYIDIGDFGGYSSQATIEAWVKYVESNWWNDIISGDCEDVFLSIHYQQLNFATQCDYPIPHNTWSTTYLNDNAWHHVAGTYDGSEVSVYVDGVKEDSNTVNAFFTPQAKRIGSGPAGYGEYFPGIIDEVRFWNIARTESEIQENMSVSLSGNIPGLIAYWPFNEGEGLTTYDATQSGNDGILVNGVSWTDNTAPILPFWLTMAQDSGVVSANYSEDFDVVFNAETLPTGDYYGTISIFSNDPLSPKVDLPVHMHVTGAPSIATDPDTLDCGNVFINYSDSVLLTVMNVGSDELIISDVLAESEAFDIFPTQANIGWGQSAVFTVHFSPVVPEEYTGTLTFFSNDPFQNEYEVHLIGEGIEPPVITVSLDSIFQQLAPDDTASQVLTIHNTGMTILFFEISPEPNHSLEYDGENDYCMIPNSPSLDIGTNEVTLELWVKLNELPSQIDGSFAGIYGSYQDSYIIYEDKNNQEIRFKITDNTGTNQRPGIPQEDLSLDVWYHIAGVYDGEVKEARIYLNGELKDTHMHAGLWDPVQPGQDATFGSGGGWENFFSGSIDEGRIWSVARTEEEINEFMLKELTADEPFLVANWRFNEGEGITAFDRSQNNNHGYLENGPQWKSSGAPFEGAWLTIVPDSGNCLQGTSIDLTLTFSSEDLEPGNYLCNMKVFSNDPATPQLIVPIHLEVTDPVEIPGFEIQNSNLILDIVPNPCSSSTKLRYQIKDTRLVIVELFEISGVKLAELLNERKMAGTHELEIDLSDLPTGVYYCVFRTKNGTNAIKLIKL